MFVNCKVNLYIPVVGIWYSHSASTWHVMGLRYWPKTTSGSNISIQYDSARISYKPSFRPQAKFQILPLLSSKGQYLGRIYFKNLQKMRMSEKGCNNNSKRRKYQFSHDHWRHVMLSLVSTWMAILSLLSSKGQYLGLIYLIIFSKKWECQKNVAEQQE